MSLFKKQKQNIVRAPQEIVAVLDEPSFLKLCVIDLKKKGKYPVYLDLSDSKFMLSSLDFLKKIKGSCFKEITLCNNHFQELKDLGHFVNLKRLNASYNEISWVQFGSHTSLIYLNLSYNSLTAIPDLSGLPNLTTLILGRNQIKHCEFNHLKKCKKLKELDLSFNSIHWNEKELVDGLETMANLFKSLKSLSFSNNPFCFQLVNYRAVLISRIPKLNELDHIAVTKLERKTTSSKCNPVFTKEIKSNLVTASKPKALNKAPSFRRFIERMRGSNSNVGEGYTVTLTFSNFNEVLSETPLTFLNVASNRLETTLFFARKEEYKIFNDGIVSLLETLRDFALKDSSATHSCIRNICLLLHFLDDTYEERDALIKAFSNILSFLLIRYTPVITDELKENTIPYISMGKISQTSYIILHNALSKIDNREFQQYSNYITSFLFGLSKTLINHLSKDVHIHHIQLLGYSLDEFLSSAENGNAKSEIEFVTKHTKFLHHVLDLLKSSNVESPMYKDVVKLISASVPILSDEYINANLPSQIFGEAKRQWEQLKSSSSQEMELSPNAIDTLQNFHQMCICLARFCQYTTSEDFKSEFTSFLLKNCKDISKNITSQLGFSQIVLLKTFISSILHVNTKNDSSKQELMSVVMELEGGNTLCSILQQYPLLLNENNFEQGRNVIELVLNILEQIFGAEKSDLNQKIFQNMKEKNMQQSLMDILLFIPSAKWLSRMPAIKTRILKVLSNVDATLIQTEVLEALCNLITNLDPQKLVLDLCNTNDHSLVLSVRFLNQLMRHQKENKIIFNQRDKLTIGLLSLIKETYMNESIISLTRNLRDEAFDMIKELCSAYQISSSKEVDELLCNLFKCEESHHKFPLYLEQLPYLKNIQLIIKCLKKLTPGSRVFLRMMLCLGDQLKVDRIDQFIDGGGLPFLSSVIEELSNPKSVTGTRKSQRRDRSSFSARGKGIVRVKSFGNEEAMQIFSLNEDQSLKAVGSTRVSTKHSTGTGQGTTFSKYSVNFWNQSKVIQRSIYYTIKSVVDGQLLQDMMKLNRVFIEGNTKYSIKCEENALSDLDVSDEDSELSELSDIEEDKIPNLGGALEGPTVEGPAVTKAEVKRIHRQSLHYSNILGDLNSFDVLSLFNNSENNPTDGSMWSYYEDLENTFSSEDFYNFVFQDELQTDDIYRPFIDHVEANELSFSANDNILHVNFDHVHSRCSLCSIVIARMVLLMLRNGKKQVLPEVGAMKISKLLFRICEFLSFESFRTNMLSLAVSQCLIEELINSQLLNVSDGANQSQIIDTEQVLQVLDIVSQLLQQIMNKFRERIQIHHDDIHPLKPHETFLMVQVSNLWFKIISTINKLPIYTEKDIEALKSKLSNNMTITDSLLMKVCDIGASYLVGFLIPLPNLAVLIRLLYYNSLSQHGRHILMSHFEFGDLFPPNNEEPDKLFMMNEKAEIESVIPNDIINVVMSQQNERTMSSGALHLTPFNQLNRNLSQIIAYYIRLDNYNMYNIVDFIVRLESTVSRDNPELNDGFLSFRSSLFQSILDSVSKLNDMKQLQSLLIQEKVIPREEHILHMDTASVYYEQSMKKRLVIFTNKKCLIFKENEGELSPNPFCFANYTVTKCQTALHDRQLLVQFKFSESVASETILFEFSNEASVQRVLNILGVWNRPEQTNETNASHLVRRAVKQLFADPDNEDLHFFCSATQLKENDKSEAMICVAISDKNFYLLSEDFCSIAKQEFSKAYQVKAQKPLTDVTLLDNDFKSPYPPLQLMIHFKSGTSLRFVLPSDEAKVFCKCLLLKK